MAVRVTEKPQSRNRVGEERSGSVTMLFTAIGTTADDDLDIYPAILAATPRVYTGLRRRRVTIDPVGGGVWNVQVEYGLDLGEPQSVAGTPPAEPALSDPLGAEFTFDTTGQTIHITQSKRTRYKISRGGGASRQFFDGATILGSSEVLSDNAEADFDAADVGAGISGEGIPANTTITAVTHPGRATMSAAATADTTASRLVVTRGTGVAPSYNRAIGVSKDGVAGCDVPAPKLEFSITRNFSFVTLAWIKQVKELGGCVNNAAFFSFDIGELMFLGATGAPGPDKLVRVTFKFAAGKNQKNIDLADDGELRIPDKRAWEHVWVAYEETTDGQNLVSRPKYAYVEEVVDFADFRLLGI